MASKNLTSLTLILATGLLQSMERPIPLAPLETRLAVLKRHIPDPRAGIREEAESDLSNVYGQLTDAEMDVATGFDFVLYLTFLPDSTLSPLKHNAVPILEQVDRVERDLRYKSADLIASGLLTQIEVLPTLARVKRLQCRMTGTATSVEQVDGAGWAVH